MYVILNQSNNINRVLSIGKTKLVVSTTHQRIQVLITCLRFNNKENMIFIIVPIIFMLANSNTQVRAEKNPVFRPDYVYNEEFSSFYKLQTRSRTWPAAKLRCQREGAVLFYPSSKAEAEFVGKMIKEKLPENPKAWIGISDLLSEGDYETITGLSVDEIYVNWNAGEPNNADDDEDCVEMSDIATMNDLPCRKAKPFICKKTLSSLEWNAFCEMPDTGYLFNGEFGKCYKFHPKPLNWTSAHAVCLAEQSYLAVINSQKEADYLVKLTADAPKNFKGDFLSGAVHIGFHNMLREGYTTVLGGPLEESGYIKWGGGQPDRPDTEFCGSMFYNGGLNDMWCSSVCYYICEHDIGIDNNNIIDSRI